MRRLGERYDNEGMTAEDPAGTMGVYNPPPPHIVLGGSPAMQAGPSMQSASMSLSVSLTSDSGHQRETFSMGNTLTVNKLPAGQAARSFESALGGEPMRTSEAVESMKQCFGQSAQSFESTLPKFGSYEQQRFPGQFPGQFPGVFSESMTRQELEPPREGSNGNLLEVPIQNLERRRHSFGPGNEGKSRKQEFENIRHSVLNIGHSHSTGDEPRRILRKQSAIDMEEMELGSGKLLPKSYLESKALEKEEKRVMSHYNIDAFSFTKQTSREEHVTVIRSPQTSRRQTVMRSQYQKVQETSHVSPGHGLPSETSCKPTLNVISNEGAISSRYRSHFLEPASTFRTQTGFSSGSEDSPGPSSREHSPFRRESGRATSPYSKERVYAAPTPVIKTQVKKEVPDLTYELQAQSSTGSEGAVAAAAFPEVTNIVITSETGVSMRCKSEEDIPEVLSDSSEHRRHLQSGHFKKLLHARYLSSLRSRNSSSSTDTSQEHLSQEFSDSLNRSSDVFESTELDGTSSKDLLQPVVITREGSSETSDESPSDIQMGNGSAMKSRPLSPSRQEHEPLDLSSSLSPEAQPTGGYSYMGLNAYSEPDLLSPSLTQQNSPSLFHRSPHLQPQYVQSTQPSPLCSVPEGGRIFQFNFPSPYEGTCAHSDPEFGTPSPISPGLHFTFPPRPAMLSSMSELNRLAVSPRAYYPNQPLQLSPLIKRSPRYHDSSPSSDRQYFSGDSDAYLCPVCTQLFPSYDNLAKHMAKHLPTETIRSADNNKIHYCKVCNRSFSRSDMLTRHMRLHTGLKPYECGECGQVFSRSDHLATHRRTHTGEKPYHCPSCPYAACRRDMITRHMRTHAKRSAKRGKFLSVPDRENSEVRKSSVSSTDTTSSQEFSSRTFSASSGDSLDLDTASTSGVSSYVPFKSRTCSLPSMDSSEMEFSPMKPRHWSTTSTDSAVFEDQGQTKGSSSSFPPFESKFEVKFEKKHFNSLYQFRHGRNLSTTSIESVDSEDLTSRSEDTIFESDRKEDSSGVLPIEPESMEKCSISSDKYSNA